MHGHILLYFALLNAIMASQVPLDWTQKVFILWAHSQAMFENRSDG